jgi:hypothetical protein
MLFPNKKTFRSLAAVAGVCLLIVVAFFFIDKFQSGEMRNGNDGTKMASLGDLETGVIDTTVANQDLADSAGAVASVHVGVVLRGSSENEEMQRRHERALQVLGLPPVKDPKPRRPLAKEPLVQPPGQEHQLLVKFHDNLFARALSDGGLVISSDRVDSQLLDVIHKHGLRFAPNHTAGEEDLLRLEAEALAASQSQPADLGGMLSAVPAQTDKEAVWAAANALQALGSTEFVTLSSLDQPPPPPMPFDIAPPSELLSAAQTYRGGMGINIDEAWRLHSAKGAGVRVTNCEYSFNSNHEDMAGLVSTQPGATSYNSFFGDDHGTAVLGILVAAENSYGMTGMIPQTEAYFYGELGTVNGAQQSRSACVTAALAASGRGDVVLLEMQTRGAGATSEDERYVPAEYDQAVWIAVKTGTDAGKHVIAAAGNGGEDLDGSAYAAYRDRGDSGSIIVGAASEARERLSFSTYGARVNLHGWGRNVATLGYGGYRTYGDDHNQKYTRTFSGTSSASPIVTAAVVAIESLARTRLGRSLTPAEMRQLLVQTGKPQTGDLTTKIGPLPDVVAALSVALPEPDPEDSLNLTGDPAFSWSTGGNLKWFNETDSVRGEVARSGPIGHNQKSHVQTALRGPGTVSFSWKVSSQASFDVLRVLLNGVEQARISGNTTWARQSVVIPWGDNTVKWEYFKNGSVSSGADSGWLDDVTFTPAGDPLPAALAVETSAGTRIGSNATAPTFQVVGLTTNATQQLRIRNTGLSNLSISSLTRNGSHAADFALGTQPASSIAPGATSEFEIRFAPTASGNRTARLEIVSNDPNHSPFVIRLAGSASPSPIESWRIFRFGSASNSGNAANLADPDKDGLPNLVEYAFGLNPLAASTSDPVPTDLVTIDSKRHLRLYIDRRRDDLDYIVEFSTNLTDWATVKTYEGIGTESPYFVDSAHDLNAPTPPRRFLRVRVRER